MKPVLLVVAVLATGVIVLVGLGSDDEETTGLAEHVGEPGDEREDSPDDLGGPLIAPEAAEAHTPEANTPEAHAPEAHTPEAHTPEYEPGAQAHPQGASTSLGEANGPEEASALGPAAETGGGAEALKRYEGQDALAVRRARQIELVVTAEGRAVAELEAAEQDGDEESAARTRGILRRIRLRRTALEAAASAPDPY